MHRNIHGPSTSSAAYQRSAWTRLFAVIAWTITLLLFAAPVTSSAQALEGVEATFYGYFSPDVETVVTLGHLQADDPSLAAELVSPQYADDFFSGFTLFTNHEFAADLDPRYLDQIDEADEYMVFKGMLEGAEGIKPGYLTFLSTSQQVFVIFAYQEDASSLFGLAEETIKARKAPVMFADFTRIELTDDAALEEGSSPSRASTADKPSRASNPPASSQGQGEVCLPDPNLRVFEQNGDGVITIKELRDGLAGNPEYSEQIDELVALGVTQIRYQGC